MTDWVLLDDPLPGVRRITMNRPEKRNALNHPLRGAVLDALYAADKDPAVRVMIVRGAGPSFSAGYDLGGGNEGHEYPFYTPGGEGQWPRHVTEGWMGIWDLAKPVIAQVHGYCLAGGSELATGCDLVYIAEDAQMGYPAVRFGVPDMHFHAWFLGHAPGDGDDGHRRLDLRDRGRRRRLGEPGLPRRRARGRGARRRQADRRGAGRTGPAQQAARPPPDGRTWACAPGSAPVPSCARSGPTPRRWPTSSRRCKAKGLTGALQRARRSRSATTGQPRERTRSTTTRRPTPATADRPRPGGRWPRYGRRMPAALTDPIETAVVLGGGSDIALATIRLLADAELLRVVLACRHPEELTDRLASGPAIAAEVDLRAWDALDAVGHQAFFDRCAESLGRIDLVLCAVGSLGHGSGLAAGPEAVGELLAANFTGPATAITAAAQLLVRQGSGTIVVLSSVAGVRARKSNYPYGAAKAGLDTFAAGLTDALVDSGVGVVVVRPGFVRSKMTTGLQPAPFATAPEAVATAIVDTLRLGGSRTIHVPRKLGPLFAVLRLVPRRVSGARSPPTAEPLAAERCPESCPERGHWSDSAPRSLVRLVLGRILDKGRRTGAATARGSGLREPESVCAPGPTTRPRCRRRSSGLVPAKSVMTLSHDEGVGTRSGSRWPCSTSSHASSSTPVKSGTSQWPMSEANIARSRVPSGLTDAVEGERVRRVVGLAPEEELVGEHADDIGRRA